MEIQIITGLIAFLGVILSVTLSYFSNRQLLKSKLKELEMQMLQQNSNRVFQKRLDCFPEIYFYLSEMIKKLKKDILIKQNKYVTPSSLSDFLNDYERINSKYGLFFSSQSALTSGKLRTYLFLVINSNKDFNIEASKELMDLIGQLEFSLKQDAGIYIDELQDFKTGRDLSKYSDVNKYLYKIDKMREESRKYEEELANKNSYAHNQVQNDHTA